MFLPPPVVASELPEIGELDRYRVETPGWPGAETGSATGSVLLSPPPQGTPWRYEEPPVPDEFTASEAIEALAVSPWHDSGLTGAGVKVAVFDVQWFNADLYAAELGAYTTHDCQAHMSCDLPMDTFRPRYPFEEGSHGVACAQVIRDIAPGVELHLVRVNGATTLENAARWAEAEGIQVASMSMSFFNNSFYDGSGSISNQAARMAAGGTLLVNSAGNYATEHWDGDFQDDDGDGDMDFAWGSSYLPVYLGSGTASVMVSWDQHAYCGDTDLDAYVYDENSMVVGRSENRQESGGDQCGPVERVAVHVEKTDWYYLRIVRYAGDPDVRIAVFARDNTVYAPTPGSIADPGASPSAFSVGAVRAAGYLDNGAEDFSSIGPTHGGAPKPDIAGPDGLTTAVYGAVGFYGTSASTPAVAAAIALLLERDPSLTPQEAAAQLQANALAPAATWSAPDGTVGAGYARLPPPDGIPRGCGGAAWVLAPMLAGWPRRRPTSRCGP